ncbi:unnamed protein product [Hymenolepis diminuta]|uniref:Tetraspanin n=1 Tax=Hymenolepis diminuta TaxID=6216 RepID=A0A0R3S7V2_HYMDI|nr:unnamed protein product [Hymenolepis diminuta]
MGCVISCGVKLVLQIFNTVLFVAFIAVAIFGILLKTSKPVVESIINRLVSEHHVNKDETAKLAQFIIENADAVSALLIVAGFVLAALCLIGCIASCCGCKMLLKIYASVLIVLVIVQVIVVAYFFSDRNRVSKFIVISMTKSLEFYGADGASGDISTAIWNLTMNFHDEGRCCGMKGYTDFGRILFIFYPIRFY